MSVTLAVKMQSKTMTLDQKKKNCTGQTNIPFKKW